MASDWDFWIDVGGTFTDSIAHSPDARLHTCKVLSSGITKGLIQDRIGTDRITDQARVDDPPGFWNGYTIRFLDTAGRLIHAARVRDFLNSDEDSSGDEPHGTAILRLEQYLPDTVVPGTRYELDGGEEAPILAIRRTLGLALDDSIPAVSVRLGTTRGTNALLTRRGARTALVTTQGFADVLLIGNQDRPRLFDLLIRKPEPLFEQVVEVAERIDADGHPLKPPSPEAIRADLSRLHESGIESVAICLLHAFANGEHERIVEEIARQVGFTEISTSSRLSPLIRIVSRGDTTVADAYLNPILRQYVESLRQTLGDSELRMMTSAGGLVDANRFVGKDSILSGPAGGVIGFSRVARQAGFEKSIGFDMGGTSTDVSRFDGQYELEFETQKAGVRIVAPMLAIETVAAGGGSVCGFDGVQLFVGPQSAGADPGPACYGRGGPLTVTDINVFLGRVLPSRFPFPLDLNAVESRLQTLCEDIAGSPMGRRYEPVELAEGFRQIANANMVRAIRRISVAKGYDPADYVLVSFGGAGSQHACAMARSLGISKVLMHPFAGILSAYGIGLADVRRFGERSVLRDYSPENLAAVAEVFRELAVEATAQVRAEGIADDQIAEPVRSLEIRYRGVESAIHVIEPDDGDWQRAYEEQHQQLYGYLHQTRPLEIVAARVEVTGRMQEPPDDPQSLVDRQPQPSETTTAWFDGAPSETGVFNREQLHPGDRITGPAILCEPTSTVVVEPDFEARIESRGEIVLTHNNSFPRSAWERPGRTLRVPHYGRRASNSPFPRRAWEREDRALDP